MSSFIKTDPDLKDGTIILSSLNELQSNVIPLLTKRTSYDIIGKFYQEFLRYAGVSDIKKGIVLTPEHITDLFVELIDDEVSLNDLFFDGACGTGSFLIAAMNNLIKKQMMMHQK